MTDDTPPDEPKVKKPRGEGARFQPGYDPRRKTGQRPRKTKDGRNVTQLARDYTEEALMKQVSLMRDPEVPAREQLKASEYILSRGWGAPKQSIEMMANVQHEHNVSRIDFAQMTQEARLNLLANMRTLPAPDLGIEDADYALIENNRETDEFD